MLWKTLLQDTIPEDVPQDGRFYTKAGAYAHTTTLINGI